MLCSPTVPSRIMRLSAGHSPDERAETEIGIPFDARLVMRRLLATAYPSGHVVSRCYLQPTRVLELPRRYDFDDDFKAKISRTTSSDAAPRISAKFIASSPFLALAGRRLLAIIEPLRKIAMPRLPRRVLLSPLASRIIPLS